jgi:phage/plasmid-associated DNA primase
MYGNPETIKYLRLKMGLFLTGELLREIDEFSGDGRNGKSTFYKLLALVMGDFFTIIPKDLVVKSPGSSSGAPSPQWFVVQQARVAFFDEVEENEKINARNVKRMANGDPTKVRGLYQGDYHQVTPKCQVVLCVNKDLIYDSSDKAMTDRVVITPWPANFEAQPAAGTGEQKQDDSFIQNIEDNHLDDLFSYMVDASIDFYKSGKKIERPKAVLEKTAKVNREMNSVAQFVDDVCALRPAGVTAPQWGKDETYKVKPMDLFREYTTWILQQDMQAKKVSTNQFPKALEKIGKITKRTFAGKEYWVGIKFASEPLYSL